MSTPQYYINDYCLVRNQQVHKNEQLVFESQVGVNDFLAAAFQHLGLKYSKFYKMDNLSKLGWIAAETLLSGFNKEAYKPAEIGVILSNANSSLDADLRYYNSISDIPSPALFVYTLPNIVIGEISIRHHFKGENAFFIFEAFNPAFLEKYVDELFRNNILQACICGWVDLVGESYEAVLYLIEKNPTPTSVAPIVFNKENLNKIYQINNG